LVTVVLVDTWSWLVALVERDMKEKEKETV
jgi:hypothetical protein